MVNVPPPKAPFRGLITAPADSDLGVLQVGDVIEFAPVRFFSTSEAEVSQVVDWSRFDGVVLAIMFSSKTMRRTEGVATMVAPGIALCAAHVFRDEAAEIQSGAILVLCVGPAVQARQIWAVKYISFVPNTDLAILSLAFVDGLSPARQFKQASITTRIPRKGETLAIMGFKADAGDCANWQEGQKIRITALACRGKVIEHYVPRRDRVLLPGPSMAVDCPSWSGMSGAPVFDRDGWLVGILSVSLETDTIPKPSGVSLLLHALGYPFTGGWPEPESSVPRTLLSMADNGGCQIERPEAIFETLPREGGLPQYTYNTWHDR